MRGTMSASRFVRVGRQLPVGVVLGSELGVDWKLLPDLVTRRTETTSTHQLTLTLEVPAGSEKEVAKALREMAEELEK